MKITKITVQKNDKERYNIFIGEDEKKEEFACGVHEAVLLRHHLRKGMVVTEQQLEEIKREDDKEKALKHALTYVSRRMRTEKEVYDQLVEQEVPEKTIDETIAYMRERSYIHDENYAKTYVRVTMSTTTKGPGRIKQYLEEKGVKKSIILTALEEYSAEDEFNTAAKVIKKKEKSMQKDSLQMKKKKLTDQLLRLGFSYAVIEQVLADDELENTEGIALRSQAEKEIEKMRRKYDENEIRTKLIQKLMQRGFKYPDIERYLSERQLEE